MSGTPVDLDALGIVAAEVVARAIRNAVLAARSLPAQGSSPAVPAAHDLARKA